MKYRITLPPTVKAGQTVRITTNSSTEPQDALLKLPKHLTLGATFEFDWPHDAPATDVSSSLQTITATPCYSVWTSDLVLGLLLGGMALASVLLGLVLGVLYATAEGNNHFDMADTAIATSIKTPSSPATAGNRNRDPVQTTLTIIEDSSTSSSRVLTKGGSGQVKLPQTNPTIERP